MKLRSRTAQTLDAQVLTARLDEIVSRYYGWLIAGLAITFAILSLAIGLQQSIWFDEAYSLQLAKQPIGQLVHLTAVDVHPPVYYLFLKMWMGVFGDGELALRMSSVVMMTLALVVTATLVKQIFDQKTAVMAMLVMVLSPMLLRYGFELRMYALATLICCVATYALYKIQYDKQINAKYWGVFYAFLVALGMLTLYYTAVIWLTHASYCGYLALRRRQSWWRQPMWLNYGLAVVLFLPWLPTALSQFTNGALANISEALTPTNLLGVISFNFVYQPFWQLNQVTGALVLVIMAVLIRLLIKNYQQSSQYFLRFMTLVPLAIMFLICLFKPMYVERYLVYFSPFLMALVGVWLTNLLLNNLWRGRFIVMTLLVSLTLGVLQLAKVGNFNFQRIQKPDIAQVVQQIDQSSPTVTNSPYEKIELASYLKQPTYFYSPHERLAGGYAMLDGSEYQLKDLSEAMQFSCFNFVYYDDQALEEIQQATLMQVMQKQGEVMKVAQLCR